MLKSKEELSEYIQRLCVDQINNRKQIQSQITLLNSQRKIPIDIAFNILTLKEPPMSHSTFIMYCILEALDKNKIDKYFTEIEINNFKDATFSSDTISFPIVFSDIVSVNERQYIGKITVKELMKMRDAQLINYNENTQRIMEKKIVSETEYYQISINKKQVKDIEDSFLNNQYIANTLTFNISPSAQYKYNNNKKELTIISETAFDIIDGYHRYLAISDIFNKNGSFDFTMEIRLCFFEQDKAKQFIWQEDQKTQMKKIVSDTFNQKNYGNQIINYLNETGIYLGMFTIGGRVEASVASRAINLIFFHRANPSFSDIVKCKSNIKYKLDQFVNTHPEMMEIKWSKENIIFWVLYAHDEISLEDIIPLSEKYKIYYNEFSITHINKIRKEVVTK